MADIVYLRFKKQIELSFMQQVQIKHIAYVSTSSTQKRKKLEDTTIYRISEKDNNIVVIDSFLVIDHLNSEYNDLEFEVIGPTQTLIRINEKKKKAPILVISSVWLLLFVGTAMTIMNFHYDVSMQEVQQRIHFLLTGEQNEFPLWIQIPYSFGLGIGMLLFFNHWFNKRFNEEPSPLEVEIFKYQQNLDNYVNHYENELNDTKPPN
ncbi:stage V sporulation protein AA [Virgibacillus natechei]|uniref:Stage V sporulation protein AA n=1 Tax=Virgibacillus natechei TaxID=1216297 RepID=A0ABS4IFD8_9BACI|nr:stage V sporulation protein AA [Virgibacillus natechei]MBP1969659.1 stage V sporulation protein AA [Virgibacillus natechei]UZD11386.1 stage V sporulation protein AA [Virgibacillus natechei]